jgi:hypothetical protein
MVPRAAKKGGILSSLQNSISILARGGNEIANEFAPFVMCQEMLVNLTMVDATSAFDADECVINGIDDEAMIAEEFVVVSVYTSTIQSMI